MRTLRGLFCLISLLFFASQAAAAGPAGPDLHADVQAFIRAYTDAVNRADVPAIMEMYDHSPGLLSVDDGEIARGWDTVREQANQILGKEGKFKVSPGSFDVSSLGENRAMAIGPVVVTVQTQHGPVQLEQVITFVLEKRQGKWLIIHDHTSTKSPEGD